MNQEYGTLVKERSVVATKDDVIITFFRNRQKRTAMQSRWPPMNRRQSYQVILASERSFVEDSQQSDTPWNLEQGKESCGSDGDDVIVPRGVWIK
ncbi:hypothetical protein Tco_0981301, partial [Tanacetum coccineum]